MQGTSTMRKKKEFSETEANFAYAEICCMQERYKILKIPASILNSSLLSSECNNAGKLQVQPNARPEFFTGGG